MFALLLLTWLLINSIVFAVAISLWALLAIPAGIILYLWGKDKVVPQL